MGTTLEPTKAVKLNFKSLELELRQGDIFDLPVDVLVCPVDEALQTQGGIFGLLMKKVPSLTESIFKVEKLTLGKTLSIPSTAGVYKRVVLVSVISPYGNVERGIVQQALSGAMEITEKLNLESLAVPILGSASGKSNYTIFCGMMLKAIRLFGFTKAESLKKVYLSVYNSKAFMACREQFFAFEQAVGVGE